MAGLLPMLAWAGALPRDDAGWVYEAKWDGVRAIVRCDDGVVTARSRRDLDTTSTWPELAGVHERVPDGTVLDGEIVTLDAAGAPSFERLQARMNVAHPTTQLLSNYPVVYMVFDLLRCGGHDTIGLALHERRDLLQTLDFDGTAATVPPQFPGPGADVLEACRRQGLEGVVCKRLDSAYTPGVRSRAWVKVKAVRRQEAVVCGWTPGDGGRAGGLGALVLGIYDGDTLRYAGKVGTGFSTATLRMLEGRLAGIGAETSMIAGVPREVSRVVRWVRPELVCEVEFLAWTADGLMRHPSYKGLRDDKDPRDVIREPA